MFNPINLVPTPYRMGAYLLTAVVAVGAVAFSVHSAYSWAYDNGVNDERSVWQSRENKELADANNRIIELSTEARQNENKHSENMAQIATYYEGLRKNDKIKNDKIIADINSGALRLRDKYTTSGQTTCQSGVSQASTSASEHNGQTGTELSAATSTFLYELSGEADDVVEQLTACQATLIEDRRLCGVKAE